VPNPHVFAATDSWSIVGAGNVLVTLWRTQVDLAGIDATDRAIVEVLATSGADLYGSVTVIEPTMSLRMSEEARTESTELQRRWMSRMKCSAYVVEGNSFAMAAVRTMTAGMSLLTRSPYPIKSFSDSMTAAEWVAGELAMDSRTVLSTIARAREARGYSF